MYAWLVKNAHVKTYVANVIHASMKKRKSDVYVNDALSVAKIQMHKGSAAIGGGREDSRADDGQMAVVMNGMRSNTLKMERSNRNRVKSVHPVKLALDRESEKENSLAQEGLTTNEEDNDKDSDDRSALQERTVKMSALKRNASSLKPSICV